MTDNADAWKEVGRRIEAARRRLRLTKRGAATKAGISEALWRHLEAGERSPAPGVVVPVSPRDASLEAAARAVALDPAPLFKLVGRDYVPLDDEPIELSASGVDLEELRLADPEMYEQLMAMARTALDRARERRLNGG